jgi:AbrB family looped-hinge helix DNA binding protein
MMLIASSKVTAQGQISIPADIRRKLGIGPGSLLEWDEDGDKIVVRRAGRFTSTDIHNALFANAPPPPKTLAELKEGIREHVRKKFGGASASD